jgi:hypothetical protein
VFEKRGIAGLNGSVGDNFTINVGFFLLFVESKRDFVEFERLNVEFLPEYVEI